MTAFFLLFFFLLLSPTAVFAQPLSRFDVYQYNIQQIMKIDDITDYSLEKERLDEKETFYLKENTYLRAYLYNDWDKYVDRIEVFIGNTNVPLHHPFVGNLVKNTISSFCLVTGNQKYNNFSKTIRFLKEIEKGEELRYQFGKCDVKYIVNENIITIENVKKD